MSIVRCTVLAAAVALSGCAASVVRSGAQGTPTVRVPAQSAKNIVLNIGGSPQSMQSADWAAFRNEWRNAVAAEASAAAIPFTMQDGEAKPTGQDGTLIAVTVNDYRYLSAGARFGLGIMTGNAYVDARVRYRDLKTGASFGEDTINTSSSAWQGVFSAMTDKQLQAIAKDLVGDVKGQGK